MHARLHADLGGKIKDNRKEAVRLAEAMKHVEAVICMFDPAFNLKRIAPRRRHKGNLWFKRGAVFPAVLDVLKGTQEPLTVRQIARQILASQGVADPDLKTIRDLEGGIRSTLRAKEGKTVVNVGQGMPARWQIALPGTSC